MTFNKNVWMVLLPFHLVAVYGLCHFDLAWFFTFWILFGVIGNGVAGHRYFAHNQFETNIIIKWVLGLLSTIGAYAPINYWRIQHLHHHANSDDAHDVHSPKNMTWFGVFFGWLLFDSTIQQVYYRNKLAIRVMREPFYAWFFKNHYRIIYAFSIALILIDVNLFAMYCLAYAVDVFRLGAVNYFCHTSGYRLYDTKDQSRNNIWVGLLGFGFGWHNTHHAHPNRLILTERWWELDIEGYIGWVLSKLR